MELLDSENEYRGDCLKLARLAKGVSGEELAKHLAVTKQYVSKLERGYPPNPETLIALADYLKVKEAFFFTPRKKPLNSEDCHFRIQTPETQALTNSILARAEIIYCLITHIEKEVVLPELNIPDISEMPVDSDEDIERIAEQCRRYWELGLGPVASMANFVESIGIIIAEVSGVDDRIDAFTVNNKRPLIIRNSAKKSVCRFRSDLGHELGHLVLHEGVITGDKLTEHQADHFSSAFLVPRVSFINEFPKMRGSHIDWNAMVDFKLRWKISLRMGLYRASMLGLISPQQMRTGFIHLNSKGYTKDEKGDELISAEDPKILSQAIDIIDPESWNNILRASSLRNEFIRDMFGIKTRPTLPDDITPTLRWNF